MNRRMLFCLLLLLPVLQGLLACNSQRYRLRTETARELELNSRIRSQDSLAVLSHHQREDFWLAFHDQQVLIRPIGVFTFHADSGFHGEAAYLLWNSTGSELGQEQRAGISKITRVETATEEIGLTDKEQTAFQESHRETQAVASHSIWWWLVLLVVVVVLVMYGWLRVRGGFHSSNNYRGKSSARILRYLLL